MNGNPGTNLSKKARKVLIANREAEAGLWSRIARAGKPGSEQRAHARTKSGERRRQAEELRGESEMFFGIFGEEMNGGGPLG